MFFKVDKAVDVIAGRMAAELFGLVLVNARNDIACHSDVEVPRTAAQDVYEESLVIHRIQTSKADPYGMTSERGSIEFYRNQADSEVKSRSLRDDGGVRLYRT